MASSALTAGAMQGLEKVTTGTSLGTSTAGMVTAGNSLNATLTQKLALALAESTTSTAVSTATQSAMNGDSFTDALKDQLGNIAIGVIANMGAKAIGNAYHGNKDSEGYVLNRNGDSRATIFGQEYQQIGKTTQLALHAALGCAVGAAGGGNCASGAVSGVVGEMSAEYLDDHFNLNNDQIKELSGLAGGFSAIATGGVLGLSDSQIASNIYSGQRIGKNAAENNYFTEKVVGEEKGEKINNNLKEYKEQSLNAAADKYVAIEWTDDPIEKAGLAMILGIGSVAMPENLTELELAGVGGAVIRVYKEPIAIAFNKADNAASLMWKTLFGSAKPELRLNYEREVENLLNLSNDLRLQGKSSEEIARIVSLQHNQLKIDYRKQSSPELVEVFEQRNIKIGSAKPELRLNYEREVENLLNLSNDLRLQGKSSEEIARTVSQARRDIGIRYKDLTPSNLREEIYIRNLKTYGDEYGPTVDYLRSKGYSWDDIIDSSSRPGGNDINFNK